MGTVERECIQGAGSWDIAGHPLKESAPRSSLSKHAGRREGCVEESGDSYSNRAALIKPRRQGSTYLWKVLSGVWRIESIPRQGLYLKGLLSDS